MAVWPSDLPPPTGGTFNAEDQESVERFQPTYGEPMARVGSTALVVQQSFSLELDDAQLAVLLEFYRVECGRVGQFYWTDQEAGETAEFVFTASPRRSHLRTDADGANKWNVAVSLMRLP